MSYTYNLSTHNNTYIVDKLIQLGVHIGDWIYSQDYSNTVYYYTIGIRNSFFVIDLQKTVYYLKRALFFAKSLAKLNGSFLFYHSSIDSFFNLKLIFYYLVNIKANQSYVNYKWIPGMISNYKRCFLRLLYVLLNVSVISLRAQHKQRRGFVDFLNQSPICFFRYIFLKLIYLTHLKSFLKRDWLLEFKKILAFWKVFIFLKSFKHIFSIPDCLVIVDPSNKWLMVSEFSKSRKIPVIGILDTGSSQFGITYPIPSNDDSIAIGLFFISLFLNICILNDVESYAIKSFNN
jgi:small subunit ribosomal protein S2